MVIDGVIMECKDCGNPQGRKKGGKCWEQFGCCMACYKSNHRGKVVKERQKCKECGVIRSRYSASICWNDNLCGQCYRVMVRPKKYRRMKLCSCGEVLVALIYQKRGVSVNTGNKVCVRCSSISMSRDNKYKLSVMI